jgi:RimJ/RimL family protein N-acetyltransferase
MHLDSPITSDRLILRCLDEAAATGPYLAWMRDPQVLRFLEARHGQHDGSSLAAFIRSTNGSKDSLLLGIFERDRERHVGNIKLGPVDWPNRRGEVGLLIGEYDCWGRGYAREAIAALTAHAFDALGLHKLTAGYLAPNVASGKAFAAAGYFIEARLRDHFLLDGVWTDGVRIAKRATD